jgi:hypothetical protein
MKLITHNPYRLLGLLAGSNARETERQTKRLVQYLEAEQEPQDDYSCPVFGQLKRTVSNVQEAASRINQDIDKLQAGLFWFYNGNSVTDEPALIALKDSNLEEASSIWSRKAASNNVNTSNGSAHQNLSTLLLYQSIKGGSVDQMLLKDGIAMKLKFLESDMAMDFKSKIAGENTAIDKIGLQTMFLNALIGEFESTRLITYSELSAIILSLDFSAKRDYITLLSKKPVEEIEKSIDSYKTKRKSSAANACSYGMDLYKDNIQKLSALKEILGEADLKYVSVSDKLADEILQCGIDYFLHFKDSETDPSARSMDLFKKAKGIAKGSLCIDRIKENITGLDEWIKSKPERDKQANVQTDLDEIKEYFELYEDMEETVENAGYLAKSCKPHVDRIKAALGSTDSFYLKVSTGVVVRSLSYIVSQVNEAQKEASEALSISRDRLFAQYRHVLTSAWAVTKVLDGFDMENEYKNNNYAQNRSTLISLCSQMGIRTEGSTPRTRGSYGGGQTSSSGGSDDSDISSVVKYIFYFIIIIGMIRACN